jgi:hypothetical protein
MSTASTALQRAFAAFHKRPPSSDDMYRILGITGPIGIGEDDTFAALIVYLDYVTESLKGIPTEFKENYDKGVEHYRQCLQDRAQEIALATEKSVVDTVERLAEKSARAVSVRTMALWIGGAIVAAAVAVAGMGYVIHEKGSESGYMAGYADALDENISITARQTWAETEDGKTAFKMHQAGQLKMLALCSGPGWIIQKQDGQSVCLPERSKQGLQGWFLP